ncbi:MAG: tail fiber domain-containing protein [Bacteroidales bacterium]|nr:tail fiber domain-containing protein [Bacteroidales bacterium]
MKNFFLIFILVSVLFPINAQIQVNSSGHIGLSATANSSYNLVSSGSNYFTDYLGINCVPDVNYKLKLAGRSLFSGQLTVSNPTDDVTFYAISNSMHAPCAVFTSPSTYYSQAIVYISGGNGTHYGLYVSGDAFSTGSWTGSDLLLKKNIHMLDGQSMLKKISKIDGKTYEFKNAEELAPFDGSINDIDERAYNTEMNLPKGIRYGFIAQEIEQEFPELVKTDSFTGLKAIDYNGMVPVLLQCIKEQQKQIEKLEDMIYGSVSFKSLKTEGSNTAVFGHETIEENELFQNSPNPFITSTEIRFNIKSNSTNAFIGIYDMNGTQIKLEKIHLSGKGSISIEPNELKPGMYLYSLIVDNKLVDTKTMVLTN